MLKIILLTVLFSATVFLFWPGRVSNLFYYPDNVSYGTPANYGLRFHEVAFRSHDGTELSGWFVPALGKAHGTVVHFHGNAQNMGSHFAFVAWLPAQGFNVFTFDYRGYGYSAGAPDREGVYQDSVAALSYISTRKDIDPSRLLVLGQSLGGSNAIAALGANGFRGVRAVAIESAFSSYRSIVREKIGEIPVLALLKWPLSYLLLGDRYSAEQVVDRISPVPLLLIYGTNDPVVSLNQGKRLLERAKEPKEFWTVTENGHLETFIREDWPYRKRLVQFFLKSLSEIPSATGSK
ncbi:alpha/beta hydrolase [Geomonas sp. RF6]|uniref:alpha/beta hydrolase n=1 Tax=Geomonas sp. RF6 TaxID=2897342 RepID=UPI001E48FC11|nr:alpha/beta hydrolase [Geomonas sp. RF6]UFS72216.1 alpha/beta hydrolase [Geomonas sp. RF6]